jgi:hypothetical protein
MSIIEGGRGMTDKELDACMRKLMFNFDEKEIRKILEELIRRSKNE